MSEKIYDKDEIARIIRRAVQLEADRSVGSGMNEKSGLTLDEICSVASESGIDPELIRAAAEEPEPTTASPGSRQAQSSGRGTSYLSADEPDTGDDASVYGQARNSQSLLYRLARYFGLAGSGSYWKKRANAPDVKIQGLEMCYEQWMDRDADQETLNQLVSELNHRFDSPDEYGLFSWMSSNGKARVKKTGASTEWYFTDNWGMYQTRVLMQSRNGRFRIRVSRKNAWNSAWVEDEQYMLISLPLMAAGGGFLTYMTLGMAIPGAIAGALIFLFAYPFIRHTPASATIKHGREVQQLGDDLTAIALEFARAHITTAGSHSAEDGHSVEDRHKEGKGKGKGKAQEEAEQASPATPTKPKLTISDLLIEDDDNSDPDDTIAAKNRESSLKNKLRN